MLIELVRFLSRVFVGFLFMFSGFVKLVDPIGSQYKFEEYFSEPVLDLEFLIPYALPFSILLIIIEIMLGWALLLGYQPKLTVWSLLCMTTFFLFLTWYSAHYNKVTDCGCFGDAIELTPWETFWKNVLLTGLLLFLLTKTKNIKQYLPRKITIGFIWVALVGFSFISFHVIHHLPLIDFRAYAVGNNITEGMKYPDNPDALPPIHDFILEDTESDLAAEILAMDKVVLMIVYDASKSDVRGFTEIKRVAEEAIQQDYRVFGVSASFEDDLIAIQNQYDLPFDFLFCDETTLKTMIRANPGIITLRKGTITGKWNWKDARRVIF